jgi:hypothetical protein
MQLLIVASSVFILVSLALAWLATAVRILQIEPLKKRFPAHQNLVKAHIDYILMALLLMAYYLLAEVLAIEFPWWVIMTMIIGGALNPFMFIVVAMNEPEDFRPGIFFMVVTMVSFTLTTIGFAMAALLVML